jgi:hypothetical protein
MFKKIFFLSALVLSLVGANAAFAGVVWEAPASSSGDTVEEHLDGGSLNTGSSDLEMPYDDSGNPPTDPQLIGLRFQNVEVPAGSIIKNAWIQGTSDNEYLTGGPVNLAIWGRLEPDAGAFVGSGAVSSAPRTSVHAKWSDLPEWTSGASGPDQRTSDISAVIEELVNQPGWVAGNSLALIIGDDPDAPSKSIRSFLSSPNGIVLHIEYTSFSAYSPDPPDGAVYEETWASLGWGAGETAVTHDVYFSDNFDAVNDGATDAFIGNQGDTFFVVGFPGMLYPDGLVPGTTYYWRIDEVEADGTTKYRGRVWSFWIPSRTAYAPNPADGGKFIDPAAAELSWTAGFSAKLHTVYFGDNFDDVNNATGGLPSAFTIFTPADPLEAGKVYYWRVDEFDPPATHKGDVWSFETAAEGGGIKGEYFKGMSFNNLVLTRTDPQIDFNWGNDGPDTTVGTDQFSCRWTGQVEAAFTETYTFYTNSDDGIRLWVDSKRLVNNWTNHSNTEDRGTIDLVAGQTYSVIMEYYEDGGGAVAQLRWESPSTPKQLIPAAALSFLINAHSPSPTNGTVGVKLVSDLTWEPGDSAASHEVYFGADAAAVAAATKASPEYKGSKALGEESLDPGALAFNTSYFWRVDEVNNTNPDSPWVGNVWTFNTGDFLVVDDFESYNDIEPPDEASNRIFDNWIDGYGTTDNGALVGNDLPPYAEQTIVHGGGQSMIYRFDNAGKTSEATLTLVWPRDWTQEGVTKLVLWFRGDPGNAGERMYVALNGTAEVYHPDAAPTGSSRWAEWVIDLTEFAGVDLTNVNSISIGFGTKNSPSVAGGPGTMYFDDIRLVQ